MTTDRRLFLKSGLSLAAGAALNAVSRRAVGQPDAGGGARVAGASSPHVRLGVATYSLRTLSRAEAIAAVQAIGTPFVNIKSFHLDYGLSPENLQAGVDAFRSAGLRIVGGGLIPFQEDSDQDMRAKFEYARAAGMPIIVAGPTPEVLPRLERFAVEYDIKIAIHNHGPEDPFFPAPGDALALVAGMDVRMGVCVDVGHTARTGRDVVEEIAGAADRLHDIHMKDLADLAVKESQCVVGQGKMPVAAIFRQLDAMAYPGYVNLEYEIDREAPLPGMLRSFDYMRGVLAGMG